MITTSGSCLTDVRITCPSQGTYVDAYPGANRRHLFEIEGDVGQAGGSEIATAQL